MSKQAYREQQRIKPIGAEGIEKCRQIVKECQYQKVNEVMVDLFTAGAILAVYDGVNEQNKAKLIALPVAVAANACFKVLK